MNTDQAPARIDDFLGADIIFAGGEASQYMPLLLGVRQELPTVPFVVVTRIPDTFAWLDWWAWTHSPGGVFDRLRSGPTSDVWISPWAQYLRKSGVGLHTGSVLTQFTIPGQRVTGAIVNGTPVTADFYIAAMPVEVMASLVTDDLKRAAPSIANLTRLQTRWMNGIQFYLTQDVHLVNGHARQGRSTAAAGIPAADSAPELDNRRLVSVRRIWVRQFRRIRYETRHHREHRTLHRRKRDAVFGARQQMRVFEAAQNLVRLLDAG